MSEFRTFTDSDLTINATSLRRKYQRRGEETKKSIHHGQRKLLISEIEFFTFVLGPQSNSSTLMCVCRAAPGVHIILLSKMFPAFTFHLYDPAVFLIENTDNIKIFRSLFTDEVVAQYANRDDVFFISDIRTVNFEELQQEELQKRGLWDPLKLRGLTLKAINANRSIIPPDLKSLVNEALNKAQVRNEDAIWNDMLRQQTWIQTMNPAHCLLKFRLPYAYEGDRRLSFLKGKVFWQVWPPQTSTETRLKPTKNAQGQYDQADWSILEYEEWCFYHNSITRETFKYFNIFTNDTTPIDYPELLNDFDSTAEAVILMKYYKKSGIRTPEELYIQVKKLSQIITRNLNPQISPDDPKYKSLANKRGTITKQLPRIRDPFRQKPHLPPPTSFHKADITLQGPHTIIPESKPSPQPTTSKVPIIRPPALSPKILPPLSPKIIPAKSPTIISTPSIAPQMITPMIIPMTTPMITPKPTGLPSITTPLPSITTPMPLPSINKPLPSITTPMTLPSINKTLPSITPPALPSISPSKTPKILPPITSPKSPKTPALPSITSPKSQGLPSIGGPQSPEVPSDNTPMMMMGMPSGGSKTDGDAISGSKANGDAIRYYEADGDAISSSKANGDAIRYYEADGDAISGSKADGDAISDLQSRWGCHPLLQSRWGCHPLLR